MRKRAARPPWLNFGRVRRLPILRQTSATECALACIAMIAAYYGIKNDLQLLRRKFEVSLQGASLTDISRCCNELGFSTRAIRIDVQELSKLSLPCILHWRFGHFVVLKSVGQQGIVVHDPARGVVTESFQSVREAFTGIALEVTATAGIQRTSLPQRLKLRNLASLDGDISRKFLAGLLLAFVCELLILTSPFYLQIVIDHVIGKSDGALLNTVVLVFAVLLVLHISANVMRQLTFLFLGHITVFDITTRVLRRLLSLPVKFFQNRELGDIQHRLQSLSRIQTFLVHSVPALVLDVLFMCLITIVMAVYDAYLTALMFAALLVWCGWRASIFGYSLRLSNDTAQSESRVQTHFLETLRTIQSVKVCNGELHRESAWRDLFADTTNTRIRLGKLQVSDSAVRQLLFQSARIFAIYWLARQGLASEMSIGTISAYVAYLGMFTTRSSGIVDRLMEYKLLEVPLNRIADIVFSEEECTLGSDETSQIGVVAIQALSFSYSRFEPAVLVDCSASIEASSLTVITGPSGCGKSTLLQIIAGNESPTSGDVLFAGKPSAHTSLRSRRSKLAAVFQGDRLLKGSIAENIALFYLEIDMDRVREAAQAACIAEEIDRLPMTYQTRIGDLGSSLSRGQVQRIILARAFYRRPMLLLLDEATSGLDRSLERHVIASLEKSAATKIVVSHSDEMLQSADTVFWLHGGRLLSSRPELNTNL